MAAMYGNPYVFWRGTDNYKTLLVKKKQNKQKFLEVRAFRRCSLGWLMFYGCMVSAQLGFWNETEKECSVWTAPCSAFLPESLWWPCGLKFYGTKWKLFILPRLPHLTEANHPILYPGLSVNRSVIKYNLRNKFKK